MNSRVNNPLQRLQTHLANSRQRAQDKRAIANESLALGERLQALNRYLANTDPSRVLVLRNSRHGEARVSSRAPGWIDKRLNPINVVARRQFALNLLLKNLFRQVAPAALNGPAQSALADLSRLFDKPMGQEEDPTAATKAMGKSVHALAQAFAFGPATAKVLAVPAQPLPTAEAIGTGADGPPAA